MICNCALAGTTACKSCSNNTMAISYAEFEPIKKGRWIKMSDADGDYYACFECGEELLRKWTFDKEYDILPHLRSIDKTPYCSNCGAKMEPFSASPENA